MAALSFFSSISIQEKLLFTKHLSVMVRAGISLSEAVDALHDQTQKSSFRAILHDIVLQLKNGQTLTSALKRHTNVFDDLYTNLVKIGEESGTLEESLSFLSEQLGKDYALRKKVKGALLYPMVVLTSVTIMGGFIAFFILPQMVTFFDSFEIELPVTTQILLFFANTMKNYGHYILVSSIVLFVGLAFLIRTSHVKPYWHMFLLHLPLFGGILRSSQLARFSRNLGTLLKSGVPITISLETTRDTLSNMCYKNAVDVLYQQVKKGKQIATSMDQNRKMFPVIVARMVGVGEKTGKLDESLLYLGDFFEEEVDTFSKNLSTILEPILLITIGLVVGFVAIAIISPIYELTGSIRR